MIMDPTLAAKVREIFPLAWLRQLRPPRPPPTSNLDVAYWSRTSLHTFVNADFMGSREKSEIAVNTAVWSRKYFKKF